MIELGAVDLVSLDIVLGAVLVLSLILGAARGLVRTMVNVVVFFLSVIGGVWLARLFAPKLTALALPRVERFAMERIVESGLMTSSQAGAYASGDTSVLNGLGAAAQEMYNGILTSGMEALSAALERIVHGVAFVLVFFVGMMVLTIVLKLIARPLRIVERIPVFGFVNRLGGAALGLGLGMLICLLIAAVVKATGLVEGSDTYLYAFFSQHTPRSLLALLQR